MKRIIARTILVSLLSCLPLWALAGQFVSDRGTPWIAWVWLAILILLLTAVAFVMQWSDFDRRYPDRRRYKRLHDKDWLVQYDTDLKLRADLKHFNEVELPQLLRKPWSTRP